MVAARKLGFNKSSILDGVRDALDLMSFCGNDNDIERIEAAYKQIHTNWSKKPTRSKLNWKQRFVPLPADTSKQKRGHSQSAEVPLERAITKAFPLNTCMWNQMPVASGLMEGSVMDKRRAIDLIYRPDETKDVYEFIELKVANNKNDSLSDAAIEITEYGLIYLFSRRYRDKLGYRERPVLDASHIRLRVLAETMYYKNWENVSYPPVNELNTALAKFLENHASELGELEMDFQFETFLLIFECPEINGKMMNENIMNTLRESTLNKETYSRNTI